MFWNVTHFGKQLKERSQKSMQTNLRKVLVWCQIGCINDVGYSLHHTKYEYLLLSIFSETKKTKCTKTQIMVEMWIREKRREEIPVFWDHDDFVLDNYHREKRYREFGMEWILAKNNWLEHNLALLQNNWNERKTKPICLDMSDDFEELEIPQIHCCWCRVCWESGWQVEIKTSEFEWFCYG